MEEIESDRTVYKVVDVNISSTFFLNVGISRTFLCNLSKLHSKPHTL